MDHIDDVKMMLRLIKDLVADLLQVQKLIYLALFALQLDLKDQHDLKHFVYYQLLEQLLFEQVGQGLCGLQHV